LSVRRPMEVVVLNCCVTETKDAPRLSVDEVQAPGYARKIELKSEPMHLRFAMRVTYLLAQIPSATISWLSCKLI